MLEDDPATAATAAATDFAGAAADLADLHRRRLDPAGRVRVGVGGPPVGSFVNRVVRGRAMELPLHDFDGGLVGDVLRHGAHDDQLFGCAGGEQPQPHLGRDGEQALAAVLGANEEGRDRADDQGSIDTI